MSTLNCIERYVVHVPKLLIDPTPLVNRDAFVALFLLFLVIRGTGIAVFTGQRRDGLHVVDVKPDEQRNVFLQLERAVQRGE